MIGRLDLYLARSVLGSYGAGLLFIVILFTLVNLLIDLSGFLEAAEAPEAWPRHPFRSQPHSTLGRGIGQAS